MTLTAAESQVLDQCEDLLKVRNALIREIDAAINPVCNQETALKATELLLDQLAQWQRTGRQLKEMAAKHHRLNA
jgi:hypothetical protein